MLGKKGKHQTSPRPHGHLALLQRACKIRKLSTCTRVHGAQSPGSLLRVHHCGDVSLRGPLGDGQHVDVGSTQGVEEPPGHTRGGVHVVTNCTGDTNGEHICPRVRTKERYALALSTQPQPPK
jgi:hypothetical protein